MAPWIGKGSVTPSEVRVLSKPAGMSSSSNASTAGSAGVMVSGSVNSCGRAARRTGAFAEPFAGPLVRELTGRLPAGRGARAGRSERVIR